MSAGLSKNINVVVAGIIGAGKTQFTRSFSDLTGFKPVFEPIEHDQVLDEFYRDMKRNSFLLQMHFLGERFRLSQEIGHEKGRIQDRSIWEDKIFAKMLHESELMSKTEYDTYNRLFVTLTAKLPLPDLVIYLDVSPEIALSRVKSRGREYEKNMSLEYLTQLRNGYDEWIRAMELQTKVVKIDWNNFRPTSDVIAQLLREL
jgi:deoxyadenosine kinase